jgi:hypothetical protein
MIVINKNWFKLRKKLYISDYLILGLIFVSIITLLYLRFTRRSEWIDVLVRVQPDQSWWGQYPPPWLTQALSENLSAYNSFGQKIATIKNLQTIDAGGSNEILVNLELKTSYNTRQRQYIYNYQPVLIGKILEIPFNQINLTGIIIGINTHISYAVKHIETRVYSIYPWKIAQLTKGLQTKDSKGNVIYEIEDIQIQNSQSYEMFDSAGRRYVTQSEDPTRKDVVLKLKVMAFEFNHKFYTNNGTPIRIGNSISLEFPSTTIGYLEISAIYD